MTQDNKKNRTSKKRNLFLGIFLAVAVFLLLRYIQTVFGFTNKTVMPERSVLYKKSSAEGFVIKNEVVYKAEGSGQVNKKIPEGERVPAGTEIAQINSVKDTSQLMTELKEIEDKITVLLNTEVAAINGEDSSDGDADYDSFLEDIQSNINNEKYNSINENKDLLQKKDSTSDKTLIEQSLEALLEKKEFIKKQINGGDLRFYAKRAGIVSYEIDGYENVLKPVEFENYTYDKLNIKTSDNVKSDNLDVTVGEPLYKIINNFEWYIAVKIEDAKDIEQYKIGQAMTVELEDETELKGKIININISGNNAVVVLYLNTYLHTDYNLRYTPLEIIHSKRDCLKIPSNVIFEKDGKNGILIKEINGIVKFKPISILGEEGAYTFIDFGDNNGYIQLDGEEKPVKTVSLFDEILYNPSNFSEGEILD